MHQAFITDSLQAASDLARSHFGKVSGAVKAGDNNQVLTEADLAVGKLLVESIQRAYPDFNIIDEETGVIDKGSNHTWVVDPIDGTSNFANGSPLYGIMLGLLDGPTPIAGGVALPSFHEIYAAEKGRGTICNGEKIHVTAEGALSNCLVVYGIDGHQENPKLTRDETAVLADIILGIRNLRTSNSVFDIAQMARGVYGACLNRTSKIWDNVAQQVIIEEAGGLYTDFFGKPMDYSNPLKRTDDNFTYCAAPAALHKQLQTIIYRP